MSADSEGRSFLLIMQSFLDGTVGRRPRSLRELPLSRREHLLRILRKLAAQGVPQAFTLMERERRAHAHMVAMLQAAERDGSKGPYWPLVKGGVFTVPRGESIEAVSDAMARGITQAEWDRLVELSVRDEYTRALEAEEERQWLEDYKAQQDKARAAAGPDASEPRRPDNDRRPPKAYWGETDGWHAAYPSLAPPDTGPPPGPPALPPPTSAASRPGSGPAAPRRPRGRKKTDP